MSVSNLLQYIYFIQIVKDTIVLRDPDHTSIVFFLDFRNIH